MARRWVLISLVGLTLTVVIAWLALGNSLPASAARAYDIPAMPGLDTRSISSGSATSVAAGNLHSCALTSAGGVKCWGSNEDGQLGDGTGGYVGAYQLIPVEVSGLNSGVGAVTAGGGGYGNHTCALTTGGGAKCWGSNEYGQLGNNTGGNNGDNSLTPVDVSGLTSGISAVSAGEYHTCALTTAGGVKCWGANWNGQLGDGTTTERLTPVDVSGLTSGVSAIATGRFHSCAMTTAGGVKCWGSNEYGQLGNGTTTNNLTPVNVSGLTSDASAVSAGINHTCALTTTGGVRCWGGNGAGQLGDGTTTNRLTPVNVSGLTSGVSAITIGAGGVHTCALTTAGGVKCWGFNEWGRLGDGTTTNRLTPVNVSGLTSGVSGVSAGAYHTCAVITNGSAKCWGWNNRGQLGDGTGGMYELYSPTPVDVVGFGANVTPPTATPTSTTAPTATTTATLTSTSTATNSPTPTSTATATPTSATLPTATSTTAPTATATATSSPIASPTPTWTPTSTNTPAPTSTATATATGQPTATATNPPPATATPTKTPVPPPATATLRPPAPSITSLNPTGGPPGTTVTITGTNLAGATGVRFNGTPAAAFSVTSSTQLWAVVPAGATTGRVTVTTVAGSSTSSQTFTVTLPPARENAAAVSAAAFHTCALTTAGGVKCWGDNGSGQLGDITTTDRLTPVNVFGLASGVRAVSASGDHTCALTTSGGTKCWGRNNFGQLGDGSNTTRSTPMYVSGLTSGVSAISGGLYHTCALTTAGGVKCWGYNGAGQLGDGTTTNRSTPVNVSGLTSGVTAISAGRYHTCALTTVGGLKCWGYNDHGQLGDGTTTNRSRPVNVSNLATGVRAISTGYSHTCALTTAGSVKCWGANNAGQLGDGTLTDRRTPVSISGLTSGVRAVSAGAFHTCALTTVGSVKCWGENNDGQLGDGTLTDRLTPANVSCLTTGAGAISTGFSHTCALTTSGGIICWGENDDGQLGDGTTTKHNKPVDVVGLGASSISIPSITRISPTSGSAGTTVTINGKNLGNARSVTFNGTAAVITSLTDTQITVKVPPLAKTGPISVVVGPACSDTSATVFTVKCSGANPALQPLVLVHGWEADLYDINKDKHGFAVIKPYLESRGYVMNCNLFYAQGVGSEGRNFIHENRKALSASLRSHYSAVKAWNRGWNGHFDLIGHSYGGLNSRFYLESAFYQGDRAYGIRVDNLFTLGSPHGGTNLLLELYPGAALIGGPKLVPGQDQSTSAFQLIDLAMLDYNTSNRQPDHTCYRLIGGNFMRNPQTAFYAPVIYNLYLPWNLYPNDIGVSLRSSLNLGTSPILILSGRYPNVVTYPNFDMHGYVDQLGLGSVNSYVRPSNTFRDLILPITSRPLQSSIDNMRRCDESRAKAVTVMPPLETVEKSDEPAASPVLVNAGTLAAGQTVTLDQLVDWTGASAFYVNADGESIGFALRDPNGDVLTPDSVASDPNSDYAELAMNENIMATYVLTGTVPGTWQILLTNTNPDETAYEVYAIPSADTTIILEAAPIDEYRTGQTATITATLTVAGKSLTGAAVTADIYRPDGTQAQVALADNGTGPDVTAGDGIYSGSYTGLTIAGDYQMVARANGTTGAAAFERTARSVIRVSPTTITLGSITQDRAVDADADELYEALQVDIPVTATEARRVSLSAKLRGQDGTLIDTATSLITPTVGSSTMTLSFSGEAIRLANVSGPYLVESVSLHDDNLFIGIDELAASYTTAAYQADSFGLPLAPDLPVAINPLDGSAEIDGNVVLSWSGNDPNISDVLVFDVRFGKSATPPLVSTGQPGTTFDPPGTLLPGSVYYWQIIARDSTGLETSGPVWIFATQGLPSITDFNPTSGPSGANVTITGINLTGVTGVNFNGVKATSFTVNSATQIAAVVPNGATTGKITVTTTAGSTQSADDFTVTQLGVYQVYMPSICR